MYGIIWCIGELLEVERAWCTVSWHTQVGPRANPVNACRLVPAPADGRLILAAAGLARRLSSLGVLGVVSRRVCTFRVLGQVMLEPRLLPESVLHEHLCVLLRVAIEERGEGHYIYTDALIYFPTPTIPRTNDR